MLLHCKSIAIGEDTLSAPALKRFIAGIEGIEGMLG